MSGRFVGFLYAFFVRKSLRFGARCGMIRGEFGRWELFCPACLCWVFCVPWIAACGRSAPAAATASAAPSQATLRAPARRCGVCDDRAQSRPGGGATSAHLPVEQMACGRWEAPLRLAVRCGRRQLPQSRACGASQHAADAVAAAREPFSRVVRVAPWDNNLSACKIPRLHESFNTRLPLGRETIVSGHGRTMRFFGTGDQ